MLYLGMDETGHEIPSVNKETQVFTDYHGFAVPVEPWAKFVAVDADGKVHCYDAKPSCYESVSNGCLAYTVCMCATVVKLTLKVWTGAVL